MIGCLMLALFLMAFCMVANRISGSVLTAPMLFVGVRRNSRAAWARSRRRNKGRPASRGRNRVDHTSVPRCRQIDQAALLKRRVCPARMLAIGLPLGFLLGTALNWALLPEWP